MRNVRALTCTHKAKPFVGEDARTQKQPCRHSVLHTSHKLQQKIQPSNDST
jgi:hypothetical protein